MKLKTVPIFLAITLVLALGSYFVPNVPAATIGPVTDSIGVVKIGKSEPITIAYWLVTSGENSTLGEDSKRGIEIAIDDKGGKLLGHSIKLIGEDSGCNADGGVTAATKLAGDTAIVAAIGSSCSSEAVPGAPILWNAGIVTVSPSNTAAKLTDPARDRRFDGYLRTAHNDLVHGKVAAEFARKVLKAATAATIHDRSPWADDLANTFAVTFKKLGGSITSRVAIAPTDTDMRPVLTRIASAKPDMIYYPISLAAGGFVTRQVKEVTGLEKAKLMTAGDTFSPDFVRMAGDTAMGVYQSSPDLTPETLGPRYKAFLGRHKKKYGGNPLSAFHAHAYDAAMMIFAAIEKVAKRDSAGNLFIGRKALRDELFATKGFKGLTGTLTCSKTGDCADPHIAVYQIVNADPAKWDPGKNPKKVFP